MNMDTRTRALVDERLIKAFWDAADHYKTTDLVICFNSEVEVDPVTVFVREKLLADQKMPQGLRDKVTKPAKGAAVMLKDAQTAFWLVAMFPDDVVVTAVIAKRLVEGGSA